MRDLSTHIIDVNIEIVKILIRYLNMHCVSVQIGTWRLLYNLF